MSSETTAMLVLLHALCQSRGWTWFFSCEPMDDGNEWEVEIYDPSGIGSYCFTEGVAEAALTKAIDWCKQRD